MTIHALPHRQLARLLVASILACTLAACATLRTNYVKSESRALAPPASTPTTRYIESEVAAHPGQSGFRLLISNTDALMSRVVLADHAQRSIDLQYYIFRNDPTGRLIAQRLLTAADRGVRVRILLDDLDIVEEDPLLDALDAHANIEVRLFNPFSIRNRSLLSKGGQFLLEGRRLNRRMHNKSFIIDNTIAIIGGRNIGDEYFDLARDFNFNDLDVTMIGPVVAQTSAMFDAYWNNEAAYPVTAYRNDPTPAGALAEARRALARDAREFAATDYAQALSDELPLGPSGDRRGSWFWGKASLVADVPEKADPAEDDNGRALRIVRQVKALLDTATGEILMISPYFIPGDRGVRYFARIHEHGVTVKLLTNSLAANDEAVVHAAYSRYRRDLLEDGMQIYELRASRGEQPVTAGGASSGVSLHAKALVVDRRHVFVGSMNMDPRSALLNTEMGVIVDSKPLADAMVAYFDDASDPHNAYHVVLEPLAAGSQRRELRWIAKDGDETVRYEHDPDVSAWRRVQVLLMRLLPVEGLL